MHTIHMLLGKETDGLLYMYFSICDKIAIYMHMLTSSNSTEIIH